MRSINNVLTEFPSIVVGITAYGVIVIAINRTLLGNCRSHRVIIHPNSHRRQNNRRIPKTRSQQRPRSISCSGCPQMANNPKRRFANCQSGLLTGTLLAVARIAGETAPLIMTILGNRYFFQGLNQPMAALPLEIWRDSLQPQASLQAQGWGAALILILMVLSLNIIVRLASRGRLKR